MSSSAARSFLILALALFLFLGIFFYRPGYLVSASGLGTLIGAEVLLIAIANYRKAFLPAVLLCFLLAGADIPLQGALLQARWLVLGVGGVVGIAVYIKAERHHFGASHFVAFSCVLSAFVSVIVSAYPEESLLKALSLLLLVLYVIAGARTAVLFQPERFFAMLVTGVEVLAWASAVSYFALRMEVFGNPNSLGAIMGIAVTPVLLWAFLSARVGPRKLRLGIGLSVATLLLLSSFARAAIGASIISSIFICVSLRQYRTLIKGFGVLVVLAVCAVLLVPEHASIPTWDTSESVGNVFLYKGKREQGVFGSRRGVWQETWDVIRERPWFGSGFGTSAISEDMTKLNFAEHHIDTWVAREHGNSYLAIAEWTGLLGVIPFYGLVLLALVNIRSAFLWVRRTQDMFTPALPAAAIVAAGLVDAMFEDWLFAVGYYLCVFVWVFAFILVDMLPSHAVVCSPAPVMPVQFPGHRYPLATPTS
jgi:O-antigen ligase